MDKRKPIESWGVFNPVGHTLLAFRDASDMHQAAVSLLTQGFAPTDLVRYSPEEMVAQVDKELPRASPIAEFGQELNLMKAHRELAQSGCSFLLVHAPDDKRAALVDALVQRMDVLTAQRYGRFIIEELTPHEPRDLVADRAADGDGPARTAASPRQPL